MNNDKYNWDNIKIFMGGRELDFKPVEGRTGVNVFESDITITLEELKKSTKNTFNITENYSPEKHLRQRRLIVDGVIFKENETLIIGDNEYLVVAILDDKIILKLTSIKL
ncbi:MULTISPECIES: hypothetical protein [unclassified Chryseobacterium]|uniref:hypothetical protein n=1 Tax=unclassified Chryseobacterium TaxID=2593645 RepID=UPI000834839D|nr:MULTISPECIES: hypothetical protein [unclassified Chryseobacterium]